jgi:hypothetical protein
MSPWTQSLSKQHQLTDSSNFPYTLMNTFLTHAFYLQAKASNETQKRANDSKSDGLQRSGADALGGVISKVPTCCTGSSELRYLLKAFL